MADAQDLFSEIRRVIKACPEPTMEDALVRAAQEFCSETWILRRSQNLVCVVGQQLYAVVPPANEQAIALKHAEIQDLAPGNSIYPLGFVYPTLINPNIGQQRPKGICFVPYTKLALVPPPDNVYPVTVELITQPVDGTAQIPDELVVRYKRALGYGALEWILVMQGEPWYDPAGAERYRMLFNQEIVKARGEAAFDFTPNQRQWIGRGFARRR